MKRVRIYKPSRHTMQSGLRHTKKWYLTFESQRSRYREPLMNWIGSQQTDTQILLEFGNQEEAENYAKKNHFIYEVVVPHTLSLRPKSYADNFSARSIK